MRLPTKNKITLLFALLSIGAVANAASNNVISHDEPTSITTTISNNSNHAIIVQSKINSVHNYPDQISIQAHNSGKIKIVAPNNNFQDNKIWEYLTIANDKGEVSNLWFSNYSAVDLSNPTLNELFKKGFVNSYFTRGHDNGQDQASPYILFETKGNPMKVDYGTFDLTVSNTKGGWTSIPHYELSFTVSDI